ncbi:MAG TPA: DUF222 domain-containing protein, partial [Trebonia sp.]|nr:DUF222 domain-containing protein [Trebonia sp.]
MSVADAVNAAGGSFGCLDEALRAADAALDYVNRVGVAAVEGSACGPVLLALGEMQAKLTAARAGVLRKFDAAGAHDGDGYGSSSAWLAARAGMTKGAAKAAVGQMHQLAARPLLAAALADGRVSESLVFAVTGWTRPLPEDMRPEADRILLEAAAAGACPRDLEVIATCAVEKWRAQQPDAGTPDDRFPDRGLRLGVTFGGAAVLRGELTPECATELRAVLEALGKKMGPDDHRSEAQRFHDGLQQACTLLLQADLLPDRAGAGTQAIVHIPLSQLRDLPGAAELEDEWIRARLGEDGYLTGQDAQSAACDAQTVPVVTGTIHPPVIDQMIGLVGAAHAQPMTPGAWDALRHAITRLAVDLVSGPSGVAAVLRRGLLEKPWNTPSLPLDIGYSHSIPGHIRRAVALRDRHCAWPGCDRPVAYCDIHHLRHQADGGETSLANCLLLCNFHHD